MEIAYLHAREYSGRAIARALDRGKSSIADELVRNRVRGSYDPRKAHHKAYVRRKYSKYQGMKIVHHAALREEVEWRLLDDQSPEAVAGYVRRHRELPPISKNAVYRYVQSPYGRKIEAHRWLRRRRKRRNGRRRCMLLNRTFIDRRPSYINQRRRVGDAEADFIESGRSGKGLLLVLVDRKTRASFLERILPVSISRMEEGFLRITRRFSELRTLTTDNDILFQHHARLAVLLHVRIFFCHPHSPQEKGSIENTNKVLRRDISKGSDISRYPPRLFRALEAKLNRRPMKVLGYRTPAEMFARHRTRKQKTPR